MKKIFAVLSLIALSGNTIPTIIESNFIHKNYPSVIAFANDNNLVDFDQLMENAAAAAFKATLSYRPSSVTVSKMNYSNFKTTNTNITFNEKLLTESNPIGIFMGTNTFTNNTNETHTYKTSIFEKKVTNTTSTKVTHGISLKLKGNAKIFNNEFEFKYDKTETNINEKTINITAPSQSFKIPAHSKYKINVYLGQTNSKGKLNLNANISGTINCVMNEWSGIPEHFSINMANALLFLPSLPKGISVDGRNNQIIFNGAAMAENVSENNIFSVKGEKLSL